MPFTTHDPVLTLDGFRMRNIDIQDPAGLFGLWSIFQKASGMTEDGVRAENMTWRLWNREITRSQRQRRNTNVSMSSAPGAMPFRSNSSSTRVLPPLSTSVESLSSNDTEEVVDDTSPLPSPLRLTFANNEHGWPTKSIGEFPDKQMTPIDLENLVTSIKDRQELKALSPRMCRFVFDDEEQTVPTELKYQSSPTPTTNTLPRSLSNNKEDKLTKDIKSSTSTVNTALDSCISPDASSETSVNSNTSSHSIVRGFKPGESISTYRSQSQLAPLPSPARPMTQPKAMLPRRKNQMFTLGASSGDDDSSMRDNMSPESQSCQTGASSLRHNSERKQTSFKDEVVEIKPKFTIKEDYGSAIQSSDEEDDLESDDDNCESAIEDDEEDEWEDTTDAVEESQSQLTFARIDSKANLVSRRSLITDKVAEGQRAYEIEAAAIKANETRRRSRTSNPNGPSLPPSPGDYPSGSNLVASSPPPSTTLSSRPVSTASFSRLHPPCPPGPPTLSPKSTRRNMLVTELDPPLRKNMLVERSHRNIMLARRHTSTDLAGHAEQEEAGRRQNAVWNQYFNSGLGEYHQRGW